MSLQVVNIVTAAGGSSLCSDQGAGLSLVKYATGFLVLYKTAGTYLHLALCKLTANLALPFWQDIPLFGLLVFVAGMGTDLTVALPALARAMLSKY